mgnify:CR=1 FL=1
MNHKIVYTNSLATADSVTNAESRKKIHSLFVFCFVFLFVAKNSL